MEVSHSSLLLGKDIIKKVFQCVYINHVGKATKLGHSVASLLIK